MPNSQQRRDAARRQLERQLAERQARQAANRQRNLIISISSTVALILAIVLIVVFTSGNSKKTPSGAPLSTAPSTAPTATASSTYPCAWQSQAATTGAPKVVAPVTPTPPKTGKVTISVKTTQGPMTFTLDRAAAPCTVESFVSLVQQNYFNSTPCHRLVTAGIYVLQCGDPTGTGTGGPGYTIPDEATGNETYPAGTIAMARTSAAHSGGSQFFIVFKDSPNLQQNLKQLQYTVFGTVTAGLGVVQKVAAKGAATGTDGKPKLPITISKMNVT